jgi:hypothetical protein
MLSPENVTVPEEPPVMSATGTMISMLSGRKRYSWSWIQS